jgi:pimeloyl-ACP methyl ester carboxylesterase
MGGMIVQRLAIDHADRLLSMTSIMSTTGDPDVGQPTADAMAALTAPPPTSRAEAVTRYLAGIRAYGSPAYYDEDRLIPFAEAAYDRCFYPEGTGRQMMAVVQDVMAGGRSEQLRSVAVPALVLHGDQDRLIDVSGGERTASVIPGARFEVLEGMGHDYPPQYWDRIVGLVAGHAPGGSRKSV